MLLWFPRDGRPNPGRGTSLVFVLQTCYFRLDLSCQVSEDVLDFIMKKEVTVPEENRSELEGSASQPSLGLGHSSPLQLGMIWRGYVLHMRTLCNYHGLLALNFCST